jgi:nucleotide-binding universal stress UspA family protein
MIALTRIVVATDFGEAAEAALNYGREFARTFGASLDVVHVCESAMTRGIGIDGFAFNYADMQRDLEAAARRQLDALLDDEDRTMLNAKPVLLISNSPAGAIVQYARDSAADLILMGTHGRGGMAHLFMGSVAERVVRLAPCPVLTVRHPEHEFVLPDALVAAAQSSTTVEPPH